MDGLAKQLTLTCKWTEQLPTTAYINGCDYKWPPLPPNILLVLAYVLWKEMVSSESHRSDGLPLTVAASIIGAVFPFYSIHKAAVVYMVTINAHLI